MTWASFINFWIMRELDMEDAIFRNYDLLRFSGYERGSGQLALAMKRLGVDGTRLRKWEYAEDMLPEIAQRIANVYNVERPAYEKVRVRLIAWYSWDRIRCGELRQWFMDEMIRKKRSGEFK